MRAQPTPRTARQSGWTVASRWLAPYLDPAIGVVATAAALASLLATDPSSVDPRLADPDLVSVVATMAAAGGLAWRRSRPLASYAVFVCGSLLVSLTGHYIGLLSVLLLFSMYSLAAHGRRRHALIGLGVGVLCFIGLALLDVPDLGASDLLQALALLLAAWAVGDAVRSRRRLQTDHLRAAVTEERLRIARELHDVVAHSMSLIAVQAGVGAHVIDTDVTAARSALDVIESTSREALTEMRRMLGVLRSGDEGADLRPVPGLRDVGALVAETRRAGLGVTLDSGNVLGDLPAGVDLAAYRVVQEALTNVRKHGGPVAHVRVRCAGD